MGEPASRQAPLTAADVERVIDGDIRRFINGHCGDVHVASVSPEGDVHLSFSGACGTCPQLSATFAVSVLPVIRRVPGVRRVTADGVNLSQAALERVERIFGAAAERRMKRSLQLSH